LFNKRKALLITLTIAFICFFSQMAEATELKALYFQNEAGQMIKADYEAASSIGGTMLTSVRNFYRSSLLYGRSVFLETIDGKVYDWSANVNGLGQPWSVVQTGPGITAPTVQKEINTDGAVVDVVSLVSFTKTVVQDPMGGTIVTVVVADTGAGHVIGITIKGVAAVKLVGTTNKWRAVLSANITVNDSDIEVTNGAVIDDNLANNLIDASIPDGDADKATTLQYTSAINSSDLKVYSFKKYTEGDNVEFFVDFESVTQRGVCFFNPPNGDVFMKYNYQMAAGRYLLKIKIPSADLAKVKEVTVKFWTSDDPTVDYIYMQLNSGNAVLK